MRALTLTQPWASLVVEGRKRYETRGWSVSFRGRIAIHAAKGMPGWARQAAIEFGLNPDTLPRGTVIGEVTIADCYPTHEIVHLQSEQEIEYGDWSAGRFAWALTEPAIYAVSVPAVGHLGLWDWTIPGVAMYDEASP